MNPFKLVGWLAIAIAIIGAFVDIPYRDLLLVLLGLIGGFAIAAEDHVRVIVTALALVALPAVLLNIPEIGEYLAAIFRNAGTFIAAGTLMIISRNVWRRYKP